jgi:hypothetical protein
LEISRWTETGGSYRTIQRLYHTPLLWLQIQWIFFTSQLQKSNEEWLKFNLDNQRSIFGISGDQIFRLIDLLDNNYLSRLAGNNGGASDVEKLLDPTMGDIGLFASLTIFAHTP